MDLVEAIDAWIDDRIEDLSDNKLEKILEILDVVSASEFADLEIDHVYDEDIYALVDVVGGSPAKRDNTEDVLRAAFFDDPLPPDFLSDTPDDDEEEEEEQREGEQQDAEVLEGEHLVVISGESALEDARDEEPEPLNSLESSSASGTDETSDAVDEPSDTADDDAAVQMHQDFLANVTGAGTARAAALGTSARPAVAPVELRAGDDLGPSFLPPVIEDPPKKARAWKQWAFAVFMIAGLGIFAFGTYRLFGTLGQVDDSIGTATRPDVTEQPTATAVPTAAPEDTAAAVELVAETPTATPVPTPTPRPRVGIRLETGDVMLATFGEEGALPDLVLVYDASANNELDAANTVIWLGDKLGLVSSVGDVLTVDPTDRQPEPELVYEPVDDLGAAIEIESLGKQIVIRTDDGNVMLVPRLGQVDPDAITFLWDAREEEASAIDIASVGDLVPIVLDDGSAQVIDTANNNRVTELRDAPKDEANEDDEPEEDEPNEDDEPEEDAPEDDAVALTVEASQWGVLVGLDDGSVVRYQVDQDDPERFDSIWDPNGDDDARAIGSTAAADRTAVVLASGSVRLVNERGGGPRIWDAEDTETLALSVTNGPSFVAVVLDSGSVVRIPLGRDQAIAPIWDLTDDTLDPATQVAVEDLVSE